jgi:hypothetical protein
MHFTFDCIAWGYGGYRVIYFMASQWYWWRRKRWQQARSQQS